MSKIFNRALFLATLLTLQGPALTSRSNAAETTSIWFLPHNQPPIPAPDFMDLFKPGAPWRNASSHVSAFGLYSKLLSNVTDQDLRTIIVGLQQRHIALAIQVGMIDYRDDRKLCPGSNPNCGKFESGGGQAISEFLGRIKKLGGQVSYIMMDEPLWFGHVVTKTKDIRAPAAPITALAANIAKQVAIARSIFPGIQIGDIEPVPGALGPSDYVSEIRQFSEAYKDATGTPLDFFDTDVDWQAADWQAQLTQISRQTRNLGIKFGVIYDSSPANTDVEWTNQAERRFSDIESNAASVPDIALIMSWQSQPKFALPEQAPGAMTYLVNRYLADETHLEVHRTETGFRGQLIAKGGPVGNAQVVAQEVDDGVRKITYTAGLRGVVPPTAVTALIALRANTQCACAGSVNVLLGRAQYAEKTSHKSENLAVFPENTRLLLDQGDSKSFNSQAFPVTAGDVFMFTVPMQAPYSDNEEGYVAVIFLDGGGREIERKMLPIQAGKRLIWSGRTGEAGHFWVKTPETSPTPSIVEFSFAGSEHFRLSSKLLRLGRR